MLVRLVTRAALALALSASLLAPALACGHSMRIKQNLDDTELLVRAERQLDGTETVQGLKALRRVSESRRPKAGSLQALELRRLTAIAVVRLEGRFDARARLHKTPKERAANLAWATAELRALLAADADSPALKMHLAEALSRTADGEQEALTILRSLREADLMTSAWGYAALAHLEASHGRPEAAASARDACEAMAGPKDARLCAAPPATTAAVTSAGI